MSGVLLVTERSVLVEGVERLAREAGVALSVVGDAGAAGAAWREADLVVLGDDAAALGVPGRRPGVVLVAGADAPDRLWRTAVEVGAARVALLPAQGPELVEVLAAAGPAPGPAGRAVGVVGGCGGAGASVLAAAVAAVAARRCRALLVDVDPLGGGAELLVGARGRPGLRWPDLAGARVPSRPGALVAALPRGEGVPVLSWPAATGAAGTAPAAAALEPVLDPVLEAVLRGVDVAVLDLPRRDDAATACALWRLDLLVLLVPAGPAAVAAAQRLRDAVCSRAGDVRLVVAGAGPLAAADVADALELPLLARLRPERAVREALARGDAVPLPARGTLLRAATAVVDAVEDLGPLAGAAS